MILAFDSLRLVPGADMAFHLHPHPVKHEELSADLRQIHQIRVVIAVIVVFSLRA